MLSISEDIGTDAGKQPNTEVLDLARNRIKDYEVLDNNIVSKGLTRKVFKKSIEAIRRCANFKEIVEYLIASLNNSKYSWSAFVFQQTSADYCVTSFVYKIRLSFGDLNIILISHLRNGDFNHNLPIETTGHSDEALPEDDWLNITATEQLNTKEEVVLQPTQLEAMAVPEPQYLPGHSSQCGPPAPAYLSTWEWPFDKFLKRIKNTITALTD